MAFTCARARARERESEGRKREIFILCVCFVLCSPQFPSFFLEEGEREEQRTFF